MNDLSQNELLSAYLDGELSAAEQAEVERLLAARPAARQLLDDLRALSAALQSLPQEKVGEDLSQRVLRAAGRRMAAEGRPEISPLAPVPLARAVFHRFVNRRTLAWLGLTAAIIVAISIYDRQQLRPGQPGNQRGAELARAEPDAARKLENRQARALKPAAEPAEPPSIQARGEGGVAASKMPEHSGGEPSLGSPGATPPPAAPAARLAGKTAAPSKDVEMTNRTGGDGQAEAVAPPCATKALPRADAKKQDAPNAASLAGPGGGAGFKGAAREPPADKTGEASRLGKEGADHGLGTAQGKRDFDQAAGEKALAGGAKKADAASLPVLVVLCDVSPGAFQNKAFDKLLDANGVTGHRQPLPPRRRGMTYGAGMAGGPEANGTPSVKEQQANAKGSLSPTAAAAAEESIYIEATPAQVKAVLAGLAAQPEVFLAVSARPVEGRPAEEIVGQYRRDTKPRLAVAPAAAAAVGGFTKDLRDQGPSQGAAGPAESKAAAGGEKAKAPPPAAARPAPALPGAAPAPLGPSPPADGEPRKPTGAPAKSRAMEQGETERSPAEKPAAEDRQQQQSSQPQPSAQSTPRQRVLFVLRIAGGPPWAAPQEPAKDQHE